MSSFQFNHAYGRATLSTMVPLALSSIAFRIDDGSGGSPYVFGSPLRAVGTCLGALGIALGPSMGLWCTGNSQTAWWSMGVRTAGLGAMGVGAWRASKETEEAGLGRIVVFPLVFAMYIMPGLLITSAGTYWSMRATPDRWCDGSDRARIHVGPQVDAKGRAGLSLRMQW